MLSEDFEHTAVRLRLRPSWHLITNLNLIVLHIVEVSLAFSSRFPWRLRLNSPGGRASSRAGARLENSPQFLHLHAFQSWHLLWHGAVKPCGEAEGKSLLKLRLSDGGRVSNPGEIISVFGFRFDPASSLRLWFIWLVSEKSLHTPTDATAMRKLLSAPATLCHGVLQAFTSNALRPYVSFLAPPVLFAFKYEMHKHLNNLKSRRVCLRCKIMFLIDKKLKWVYAQKKKMIFQ